MFSIDKIVATSLRLMPKGKATSFVQGGVVERMLRSLAHSELRVINDIMGIYDGMFPDNVSFSEEDASSWEQKLGIVSRQGVSFLNRKNAISQKMFYPSSDAPRQYYLFIQEQLRAAGFDVYVHLNTTASSPSDILSQVDATYHADDLDHGVADHSGISLLECVHMVDFEHGDDAQHGAGYDNFCINYVDESKDAAYVFGGNYAFSFFISGLNATDFASLPASRKDEFRQLVLQLKPIHAQAILFINYL